MKSRIRSIVLILLCLGVTTPLLARVSFGIYGKAGLPLGDYSKFVAANAGGGMGVELDPIFVPNLGISFHADFYAGFPKDDRIRSIWDFALYGGIWYRLNWGSLAFQPELNYGICIHRVAIEPGWHGPEGANVDQMLQLAPALRWTPGKKFNNTAAIDIAPYYTMIFEQTNLIHQLGLRIGLTYALN